VDGSVAGVLPDWTIGHRIRQQGIALAQNRCTPVIPTVIHRSIHKIM